VYSFLSELRGDLTNGQPFYYELLQVLHVLLRRYPVFVPKVAKFNCAKALRGAPELVWALLTDEKEQPKKVSFLSFLVRLLVPLSTNKLSSFVLELCLDSSVLIVHNQQFVTFASEIRRKVLGEIYSSLEEEIARTRKQKQRLLDTNIQTHKFVCYSLLLTHLCQSKPIARMVFKNATDNTCSFNFPKLYIEALKSVPLQGYYNFDKVLDFLTETLAVLYNLAIYNLFQKPRAFIEGSNKPPGND
jgi:E3 ubiquitin-protein ligase HUWE1